MRWMPRFAVLLFAVGFTFTAEARHLPADQLVAHLLSVADREWRDWGQTEIDAADGQSRIVRRGAVETDRGWLPDPVPCAPAKRRSRSEGCHHVEPFDAHERVRRYWREGLGPDSPPARDPAALDHLARHSAWSAVFVSFLMAQVGLSPEAFPFDDSHSTYLRGLAERADDPADPALRSSDPTPATAAQFAVLLVADTPLAPGDLVCGPRNMSRDPLVFSVQTMRTLADLQRLRGAHCDLVVAVDRRQREARVIGGNVADSVAMTHIPLTADGRAIRILSRPWFVVARPR